MVSYLDKKFESLDAKERSVSKARVRMFTTILRETGKTKFSDEVLEAISEYEQECNDMKKRLYEMHMGYEQRIENQTRELNNLNIKIIRMKER